jgi:hypothetical protein
MFLSTITLPDFSHHNLGYDLSFSTKGFKPNLPAALEISLNFGELTAYPLGILLP